MEKWTWRETVASWVHQLAFKISPPQDQTIVITDGDGDEVFSVSFEGGFCASGPIAPYTAHSREYVDNDDMIGTLTAW